MRNDPDPSFVYLDAIIASQMETADAVDMAFDLAELTMTMTVRLYEPQMSKDVVERTLKAAGFEDMTFSIVDIGRHD